MTVFNAFFKILKKNKSVIILYTVLLVVFSVSNLKTNENNISFVSSKPNVLIVNDDEETGITKDFIKYIKENSKIIDVAKEEEKINDAVFNREVNYVIYIPKNYRVKFLNGDNPEIKIKSTGDYQASFEEMIVSRYIKIANIYKSVSSTENELISKINETLSKKAIVKISSKLDTDNLARVAYYYNFASYSLLACLILVIGLILSSFYDEKIRKRIVISKMNHKKHNALLLISNCCYSIVLWLIYVIISIILLGKTIFTVHGLIFIINSFILVICITTMSLFIGTLVNNKSALSGISNVISLSSSFLCGAFIPVEWLPNSVLIIAHIFPTYYYINSNEKLKVLEVIDFESLKPILNNMIIILIFSIIFIILTNIVSNRKKVIN